MEKKSNKQNKIGFKIFFLIFIIISILIIKKGNQNEIISNVKSLFNVEKTLETIGTIPMGSDEEVNLYDNKIIKKDNEKLVAFELEGIKSWEKNIDFDENLVFLGNKFIYLCNKELGDIQVLRDNGESTQNIKTNPQISNVAEKDDNLLLLFKKKEKEELVIMGRDEEILGNTSIEGAHIFSTAINNSKTKYAISTLKTESGNISNYVCFYKINGEEIKNIDLGENLILYIEFIADNSIIVLTDEEILCLNDGNIIWTQEFEDGEDIYIDKENGELYLLYEKNIKVLSSVGKVIREIDLTENYKKMVPFNTNKLLLYGDEYIMILDGDRRILKYKNEEKIKEVIVKKSNIILIDSDKINIMDIKNKL